MRLRCPKGLNYINLGEKEQRSSLTALDTALYEAHNGFKDIKADPWLLSQVLFCSL